MNTPNKIIDFLLGKRTLNFSELLNKRTKKDIQNPKDFEWCIESRPKSMENYRKDRDKGLINKFGHLDYLDFDKLYQNGTITANDVHTLNEYKFSTPIKDSTHKNELPHKRKCIIMNIVKPLLKNGEIRAARCGVLLYDTIEDRKELWQDVSKEVIRYTKKKYEVKTNSSYTNFYIIKYGDTMATKIIPNLEYNRKIEFNSSFPIKENGGKAAIRIGEEIAINDPKYFISCDPYKDEKDKFSKAVLVKPTKEEIKGERKVQIKHLSEKDIINDVDQIIKIGNKMIEIEKKKKKFNTQPMSYELFMLIENI